MRRMRAYWVPAITIMLALGLAASGCGGSDDDGSAATEETESVATDDPGAADLGGVVPNSPASVTAQDQAGDGSSAMVERVDLPAPGFVLVLDTRRPVLGELGEIIGGSELLPAGVSSDVEIALDPTLERSGLLVAEPHVDSNENGELDWDPVSGPVIDLSTLPETGSVVKTFAEFEYTVR